MVTSGRHWIAARLRGAAPAVGLLASLIGCSRQEQAADDGWTMAPAALSVPAPPGSRYPSLAPAPNGGVVLSWIAPAGDGANALQYSNWSAEGWSAPVTVASGAGWFVNWADFASVWPLENGLWAAHWLEQRPGSAYSYDVRVAVSTDQGRSWSTPMSPHHDGTPTEHGFVSLAAANGGIAAIWLDGRNTGGGDHEAEHDATAGAMTLRTAVIDAQGRISGGEAELDARVCDCCQTDVAESAEGLVVAYRDRDDSEVRDISVVRATETGWSAPTSVHHDGWQIAACPVNGPAIAARGRTVAVAWFTAPDQPRIRLAFSDDAGRSFASPQEIDAGRVAGRVDLQLLDAQRAVVSWLAETANGAEIRAQLWTRAGAVGSPLIVGRSSVNRASGFPRMAHAHDALLFAWTEAGATPAVRTAILRLR
jgi:hypothetical protein